MSTVGPVAENTTKNAGQGPRTVVLVASLILTILAFQLNASLLSPALPQMEQDLGINADAGGYIQSLFFLSGSVLGMIMARWSDAIGRRQALLICMGALIVGSILTIAAPSLPLLLVGRVLQGSSSATFTIAYLILSKELSLKQFGTAVGVITAANGGLGGFDGYIGGFMTDHFGWRSLFAIILVVSAIATICVFVVIPKRPPVTDTRMDWLGAVVLGAFLICLTQFFANISDATKRESAFVYLAAVVVTGAAFVLIERNKTQPLIAVSALRTRTVWPLLMTTFLTLTGVFASTNITIIALSQNAEVGYGLNAARSGLLYLVPTAISGVIVAALSGKIAQKIGWVTAIRMSTGILVVVSAAMAIFATDRWLIFGLLIICGAFYLGQYQASAEGLAVLNAPKDAPGSLPGIHGACFGLGAGAGTALVGPLLNHQTVAGYQGALWISAGMTVLAFLCSLVLQPAHEALPARLLEEAKQ